MTDTFSILQHVSPSLSAGDVVEVVSPADDHVPSLIKGDRIRVTWVNSDPRYSGEHSGVNLRTGLPVLLWGREVGKVS